MLSPEDIAAFHGVLHAPQPKKKKGNFVTSLIPSAGGIGGSLGGAAIGTAILPGVGTLAGALLGGALGGGAGKVAENAVEGNKLTSGVAGEAALNGVLGAGPLRLGKVGLDTIRGVRAGTSLADAVVQAGNKAASMSATKAVGDKLQKSGQSLIAKEFRLNPTQQANFKKLTGEEAVSVLRRYGIKKPEDLAAKIAPLQSAFDSVVQQIPSASKAEVSAAMKAIYNPLIKSPVITRQQLGQQVKAQADAILKQSGKEISATELNGLKQAFDDAVNYTQHGTNEFTVNKKSADAIRKLLQTKADQAGLKFEGKTFKDVGLELRKLHNLDDIVGKQSYLGTGSLPFSLGNTPGAVIGSTAGPLGAASGYAFNALANSPVGRRAIAQGAIKSGEKLSSAGAAANPFGVKAVTSRIAPVGLASATMDQSLSKNSAQTPTTMNTSMPMPSAANISPLNQTSDNMSSPFAPQNLESAIQKILENGGSLDDAAKFVSLAETLQKLQSVGQGGQKLNSTAAGVVADTQTGLNSLADLYDAIGQSSANNPIIGQLRGLNPLDTNAQTLQQQIAATKQIVGKALEGGVLRKEDEAKYAKILPTLGDTDVVAKAKIEQLYSLISQRLNEYQSQLGGGGGGTDTTDLASALLAAQGGY